MFFLFLDELISDGADQLWNKACEKEAEDANIPNIFLSPDHLHPSHFPVWKRLAGVNVLLSSAWKGDENVGGAAFPKKMEKVDSHEFFFHLPQRSDTKRKGHEHENFTFFWQAVGGNFDWFCKIKFLDLHFHSFSVTPPKCMKRNLDVQAW